MMMPYSEYYKPEPYSAYKNRVVKKHLDKITNQVQQINSCSLQGSDKKKLKEDLIKIIQETI